VMVVEAVDVAVAEAVQTAKSALEVVAAGAKGTAIALDSDVRTKVLKR